MQGALSGGIRSGRLYGMMGGAFEDLDKEEEATRAYRLALRLSPGDSGYRLSLARVLERRGRRPEAAAELRAALKSSPGDPACSGYLAYLYALEGINLAEAAQLAAAARNAQPRNARHLVAQGWVCYRRGRMKRARKLLELAVLRQPRATPFDHLGDACFALGLWRRAEYAWGRALELEPGRPGIRRKIQRLTELSRP
jgi:Flp pilus assembly protein TadD